MSILAQAVEKTKVDSERSLANGGDQHMVTIRKRGVQMPHPAPAAALLLLWPGMTFCPPRASHKVLGSEGTFALNNVL